MLRFAAVQNLAFAAFAILSPLSAFHWFGLPLPVYPELWQCVGMLVGVIGLGFAIAALDPERHWAVVFIGLAAKVTGVLGFAIVAMNGRAPWELVWVAAVTDMIWWLPFSLILANAYAAYLGKLRSLAPEVMRFAFRTKTQDGITLEQLSKQAPVLLVFLRHAGCTFCREALSDLSRQRRQVEQAGVQIALAHMGSPAESRKLFERYGLNDLPRFNDPNRTLYRAFGLTRGKLMDLFGPRVWVRGVQSSIFKRHGVGRMVGDSFQMPGIFLLYHGHILRSYRHKSVADRPDYAKFAAQTSLSSMLL